jgi:inorganic pyrophosphatase
MPLCRLAWLNPQELAMQNKFPDPYYHWRPHPWHGLPVGPNPPALVHAYIEITPFALVKYEVDKVTGYLRVDRPQRTSSVPPALYGFIPRTYGGQRVASLSNTDQADGDPLDICVLSERPINLSEVILNVQVVGGIQTIDNGEADDKIIAVLENDSLWGDVQSIADLPLALVERLKHYFASYKIVPGQASPVVIRQTYDRAHALQVVQASIEDYDEIYGGMAPASK